MSIYKKRDHYIPELNTSSLPDLIFSVLFFFMIVTSMRKVELKVKFKVPAGTELEKLQKKSTVSYIYIGQPSEEWRATMGNGTRIQLNDKYANVSDIMDYISEERSKMAPEDVEAMTVSIKADQHTNMGVITDVKQVLRRSYALKINYSAVKR